MTRRQNHNRAGVARAHIFEPPYQQPFLVIDRAAADEYGSTLSALQRRAKACHNCGRSWQRRVKFQVPRHVDPFGRSTDIAQAPCVLLCLGEKQLHVSQDSPQNKFHSAVARP